MTRLVQARARHSEVRATLEGIEAEGIIDLNARKEAVLARQLDGHRYAIVDAADRVVGYISGSFAGGHPEGHDIPEGHVVAFIALIALKGAARGQGHGAAAIQSFARLAREEKDATFIGLNLDENGDVKARQTRFEHMGFEFVDRRGLAAIADLIDSP